jgi:hypothetical protein
MSLKPIVLLISMVYSLPNYLAKVGCSRLKTIEGIEVEVREQIQKYISPEIGVFLSRQKQVQQVGEPDRLKVA